MLLIKPAMVIEYRLEELFERITANFAMPLRVVFWFGREFKLSSEPTIVASPKSDPSLKHHDEHICVVGGQ